MSKEREMIEKLCSFQMTYSDWLLLIADAEELLAQPEQEPVAWCIESKNSADWCFATDKIGVIENAKLLDEDCDISAPFPLYISPPKRDPLIYEHLEDLVDKYHGYPMTLGRAIEKAHGIGGEE